MRNKVSWYTKSFIAFDVGIMSVGSLVLDICRYALKILLRSLDLSIL